MFNVLLLMKLGVVWLMEQGQTCEACEAWIGNISPLRAYSSRTWRSDRACRILNLETVALCRPSLSNNHRSDPPGRSPTRVCFLLSLLVRLVHQEQTSSQVVDLAARAHRHNRRKIGRRQKSYHRACQTYALLKFQVIQKAKCVLETEVFQ